MRAIQMCARLLSPSWGHITDATFKWQMHSCYTSRSANISTYMYLIGWSVCTLSSVWENLLFACSIICECVNVTDWLIAWWGNTYGSAHNSWSALVAGRAMERRDSKPRWKMREREVECSRGESYCRGIMFRVAKACRDTFKDWLHPFKQCDPTGCWRKRYGVLARFYKLSQEITQEENLVLVYVLYEFVLAWIQDHGDVNNENSVSDVQRLYSK